MTCKHEAFTGNIHIERPVNSEDGSFRKATVSVHCTECGLQFHFTRMGPTMEDSIPLEPPSPELIAILEPSDIVAVNLEDGKAPEEVVAFEGETLDDFPTGL